MKTILTKKEKELELRKELLILSTLEIKPNYSALSRKYNIDRRTVKNIIKVMMVKEFLFKKKSKLDKYQDEIRKKLSLP